ncbi:MAG: DUF58 domain-containing protein [Acidobacteria bacterium]|nr:DUF58 domain-containing protein [Acidobacteriota bacterium]
MKAPAFPRAHWKDTLPGMATLALALIAAVVAAGSTRAGNRPWAAALSLVALALAFLAGMILVPKLLSRVRLQALESLQLFRFTGLGMFFTFLVVVLAGAALNTANNLLFLIVSVLLASCLISGVLARLVLNSVAVDYRFPDHIYALRPAHFLWILRNEKRRFPIVSLRGEIRLEGTGEIGREVSLYLPFLEANRTCCKTVRYEFPSRGVYRLARVNLATRFPFGFFQRGRVLRPKREILVYPEVLPVENFMHLLPFLQGEREGLVKGQGESLYQVRQYQDGDNMRHIHWRSSAKAGRLMVRDFCQAHENRVCICLDSTQRHDKFERAVTLAASIASHFHDEGAYVQLVTGGGSSNPDRSRQEQITEILEMLAKVQARDAALSFWEHIPRCISFVRPNEVFKIVLTAAAAGSVPAPIWRTSHVIYFPQL